MCEAPELANTLTVRPDDQVVVAVERVAGVEDAVAVRVPVQSDHVVVAVLVDGYRSGVSYKTYASATIKLRDPAAAGTVEEKG